MPTEPANVIDLSHCSGHIGLMVEDPSVIVTVRWPVKERWDICEYAIEGADEKSAPVLLKLASKALEEHFIRGGAAETIEHVPTKGTGQPVNLPVGPDIQADRPVDPEGAHP